MRGYALGAGGDAAALTFTYQGEAENTRELASGELRRQLGLKLRAQDGCNVVYVMWRLDPTPKLEVSVKFNPGKRTHEECGADGYTKVKPARRSRSSRRSSTARPTSCAPRLSATSCSPGSTASSFGRAGSAEAARALAAPPVSAPTTSNSTSSSSPAAPRRRGHGSARARGATIDAPRIDV